MMRPKVCVKILALTVILVGALSGPAFSWPPYGGPPPTADVYINGAYVAANGNKTVCGDADSTYYAYNPRDTDYDEYYNPLNDTISSITWIFDDGPNQHGQIVNHRFTTCGWHVVELAVDDTPESNCCKDGPAYTHYNVFSWSVDSVTRTDGSGPIFCNQQITLQANTCPTNQSVGWTAQGGTPESGNGNTFQVSFAESGTHHVTTNCGGSIDIMVDCTAPPSPTPVTVAEGSPTYDIVLHGSWTSVEDSESGISEYRYALGLTATGESLAVPWASAGLDTSAAITVPAPGTYYFLAKAVNGAGMESAIAASDAVEVQGENVEAIADLSLLADGTRVLLAGKVVTAGTDKIQDAIYIQEPGNSPVTVTQSGIRVLTDQSDIKEADYVTLAGVLGTDSLTTERYIQASGVTVTSNNGFVPQEYVDTPGGVLSAVGRNVIVSGTITEVLSDGYLLDNNVKITTIGLVEGEAPDYSDGDGAYCIGVATMESGGQTAAVLAISPAKTPFPNCPHCMPKNDDPDCDDYMDGESMSTRIIGNPGGNILVECVSRWDTEGHSCGLGYGGDACLPWKAYSVCGWYRGEWTYCILRYPSCAFAETEISAGWRSGWSCWYEARGVHEVSTTSMPNGSNILQRECSYCCNPLWPPNTVCENRTCSLILVDNLAIDDPLEPAAPRILAWDGINPVRIDVPLHDGCLENQGTTVGLHIYGVPLPPNGPGDPIAYVEKTGQSSSGTTTLYWDGSRVGGGSASPGLYTYYLDAHHWEYGWHAQYKSNGHLEAYRDPNTSSSEDWVDILGELSISSVNTVGDPTYNQDGTVTLHLSYILKAGSNAYDCRLTIYDSNLNVINGVVVPNPLPKSATPDGTSHEVTVTFKPGCGKHYFVISAADSARKPARSNGVEWTGGSCSCLGMKFLEPTGTIGGTIPVRLQVRTAGGQITGVTISDIEVNRLSGCPDPPSIPTPVIESQQTVGGITTTIYRSDWNTVAAHNGPHRLSADVWFTDCTPYRHAERQVTVKNLVVSAQPEYLLYDPDKGSGNVITYSLEDAVADSQTQVTVYLFDSDQTPIKMETFNATTGTGKTYVWDGKDSSGNLMPKGIYLYKISASQASQGDTDCEKSNWAITSTSLETIGSGQGQDQVILRIGYRFGYGSGEASAAKMEAFDPDISKVATRYASPPIPVDQDNYFSDFTITLNKDGDWRFLVSVWDNNKAADRNHYDRTTSNHPGVRPLLQKNQKRKCKKIMAFLDAGHCPGYSSGTSGYYDNNCTHDRYAWAEREATGWVREHLSTELKHHSSYNPPHAPNNEDAKWTVYNVQLVPRYMIYKNGHWQSDGQARAGWVDTIMGKETPPRAAFISLHCNGVSSHCEKSRETLAYYNTNLHDSQAMAGQLIGNLPWMLSSGRRCVTLDGTPVTQKNQGMLRALADHKGRSHTWKMPGNLLELVRLTNADDEDLIGSEAGQAAFSNLIHSTYCDFDFGIIYYKTNNE